MSFPLRTRTRGRPGRNAGVVTGVTINPLTVVTWAAVFFAEDATWSHPADGAAISQWDDGSGNSRHASQATESKKPTYTAADATLNGKASVAFSRASTQSLGTASWTLAQPVSYVAVAYLSDTTGEHYLVGGSSLVGDTNSSNKWQMYAGSAVVASTPLADTSPHLFTWVYNGASSKAYIDGTEVASGSPGSGGVSGGLKIARFNDVAETANWDGAIAFVGVYAGDITAHAQYANLKTFVAAHYGLTVV